MTNPAPIQCDSCDGWFHAKGINQLKTYEYSGLCNASMAWECTSSLFPGVDTPVRDIGKPSTPDKRETSGAKMRTRMNPGLNKEDRNSPMLR